MHHQEIEEWHTFSPFYREYAEVQIRGAACLFLRRHTRAMEWKGTILKHCMLHPSRGYETNTDLIPTLLLISCVTKCKFLNFSELPLPPNAGCIQWDDSWCLTHSRWSKPSHYCSHWEAKMMMLLEHNRLYRECKGKRRHKLWPPRGTFNLVEGGKPYTALLKTVSVTKIPGLGQSHTFGFSSSLSSFVWKTEGKTSYLQIPHRPSWFLYRVILWGKTWAMPPRGWGQDPPAQRPIGPEHLSGRGGFHNKRQPTWYSHSPGMNRASA